MSKALGRRLHLALEKSLPERRIFLKSDADTRFMRVGPGAQLLAITGSSAIVAWTIVATAILLMDSIGSGSLREQAQREQEIYEARLDALSHERDARAMEAAEAHDRFNEALEQLGAMQTQLLAAETRLLEAETGMDVSAGKLRIANAERAAAQEALAAASESGAAPAGAEASESFLVAALEATAAERDRYAAVAAAADARESELLAEQRLMEQRNEEIFSTLEEAVTVSIEPLEQMFRAAGLPPERLLNEVRRGYAGQGGPLTPILSTRGVSDGMAERANAILSEMEEMDLYRVAAQSLPFANPVPSMNYRQTSGFGPRRDPIRGGTRMHNGLDFAGPRGTPIHSTGAGTVIRAGWFSGYGRTVEVQHAHGVMTRYAHLTSIDVKKGQRVSRGQRIGGMGTTGRSTGVHLHYEVRVNGSPVNPMTYIKAAQNVF